MITFFDLIQDNEFRVYVEKRLAIGTKNFGYSFPSVFPSLYKYRPMSKYAVEDIIEGRMTATSIGEFNDLFDGVMHNYGTKKERIQAAENKWNELKTLFDSTGIECGSLKREEFVENYVEYFKTESRLKFRELDYLGTYVCCLSSKCDSTLMWAHYANSNMGICVEYDFNGRQVNPLQKNMLFPVAYSKEPVDIHDLLSDDESKPYQYPLEAAVLCSALNKATVWDYENEWRLVFVLATDKGSECRLPVIAPSTPKSITFGYHFLKPFFYYNQKSKTERDSAREHLCDMMRLLSYIKAQNIPVSIMTPAIGGYALSPKPIDIDELMQLMKCHFDDNKPKNIRYYYVVHDELMDLLEE